MTSGPTVFAVSSGRDRAGVAIVRISGPDAGTALSALARLLPKPRMATRAALADPRDSTPLDQALVLWFPAPHSFTGENVSELHVHGGRAVVAGVLDALGAMPGLRMAEPGEFTRRAFENGKIDLTEAEGLADLIAAETDAQRRQALRQMSGELHRAAEKWRGDLVRAQALVEAAIDFADEADVSDRAVEEAVGMVQSLYRDLRTVLQDEHRGEIIRDGFRVVIVGPPNVGKSSLINAIAKRDAAIVSEEPGTTRDVIELQLNLGGLAVVLMDTAGLRVADGKVEREGIRRGLARAAEAEMILWVMDATAPRWDSADLPNNSPTVVQVMNKIDLLERGVQADRGKCLEISAVSGEGISELETAIIAAARERTHGGEPAVITNERHREHISESAGALEMFIDGDKYHLELRAEDLRRAASAIGKLVGRIGAEEVLGEIFGRFCIGK